MKLHPVAEGRWTVCQPETGIGTGGSAAFMIHDYIKHMCFRTTLATTRTVPTEKVINATTTGSIVVLPITIARLPTHEISTMTSTNVSGGRNSANVRFIRRADLIAAAYR